LYTQQAQQFLFLLVLQLGCVKYGALVAVAVGLELLPVLVEVVVDLVSNILLPLS
jgi:hypothetical protein